MQKCREARSGVRDGLTVAYNDAEPCKWRMREREKGYSAPVQIMYFIILLAVSGPRIHLGDFHSPPINIRLCQLLQHIEPNTRTEIVWYMVPGYTRVDTVIYRDSIRITSPWTQGVQCQSIRSTQNRKLDSNSNYQNHNFKSFRRPSTGSRRPNCLDKKHIDGGGCT